MAKAVTLKNSNDEEVYPVTDISLVNGNIGTSKIDADAVTTAKIADEAITADKIADTSITQDKWDLDTYPCGMKTYWSSSNYTATTDSNLGNVTLTLPVPSRVMFHIYGILKTSRYTSHIALRVDGTEVANAGTNITSFVSVNSYAIVNLTAGTHTVALYLGGQDSGTTATLAAYANNGFAWWCV